jgi:hypothetical protein
MGQEKSDSVVEDGLKAVEAEHERKLSFEDTVGAEPTDKTWDESLVNVIAASCHSANRAYCIGIGDNSQPTWEDAPDWQKSSAKNGVRAKLKDPNVTPEQSHEGWLAEKAANGWKYGAVKDPEKKEHPCFKPYAELDAAAKVKDDIFLSTVLTMGKVLGLI